VRAGHEVTVLTAMPNHPVGVVPPEYRGRALVRERLDGVNVVRTWIYAAANRARVKRSIAYASYATSATLWGQLHVGEADVVVATSPQLLCGLAGRMVAGLRRTPFVFEVRDLWPEGVAAVGALSPEHPVYRGLQAVEEHLYRSARAIVVVTDGFRTRLVDRGVPGSKVHVIKNGVDLRRFTPAPRETPLRAELGLGDRFVAGYVGTHGMTQGLDSVLDAARRLASRDDVRFLFVGEGAEKERLERRVREERIDNVRLLGLLPRERMPEVYATIDLALVPLKKLDLFTVTIPSKLFEILAMARPVLLSVDGEARSIVEASGGGVFVPPEDVGAMVDGVARFADDRSLGAGMGERGRAYVTREFDRDALARRYLDILTEVAA
jgi:colanic acid biosynthesis glycosyl transferase WcaI